MLAETTAKYSFFTVGFHFCCFISQGCQQLLYGAVTCRHLLASFCQWAEARSVQAKPNCLHHQSKYKDDKSVLIICFVVASVSSPLYRRRLVYFHYFVVLQMCYWLWLCRAHWAFALQSMWMRARSISTLGRQLVLHRRPLSHTDSPQLTLF